MDYLQYVYRWIKRYNRSTSFKPYYKWITFNTKKLVAKGLDVEGLVLNLIINGLPSILSEIKKLREIVNEF